MNRNLDTLLVATQLVKELGEDAVTISRNRLVELIAANNRRAADFWREVLCICQEEVQRKHQPPSLPTAGAGTSPGLTGQA